MWKIILTATAGLAAYKILSHVVNQRREIALNFQRLSKAYYEYPENDSCYYE